MRHSPSTLYGSALRGALPRFAAPGAIEWEELPSLVSRVRSIGRALQQAEGRGLQQAEAGSASPSSQSVWDATRPAELDAAPTRPSDPFREPVQGVSVREVVEPDVFRHFFGC